MFTENNENSYYYRIILAYELPYNVLDSHEPNVVQAREVLYENLATIVPKVKYDKFSVSLSMNQLHDTFNYLVTYEAYFRATDGLPMEEYVSADELKEKSKRVLEEFFNSLDCDYKQVKIKPLL